MKSFKTGILALLICLLFTACSESADNKQTQTKKPEADISVKESEFSNSEKELIFVFAQDSIPYQVVIHNKKVKKLTLSIDEYSKGKFIQTIAKSSTSLDSTAQDNPINLLFARQDIDAKHERWLHAILFKNGSSISTTDPFPIKDSEDSIMGFSPVHLPLTMQLGEKKVLGSFTQTDSDGVSIFPEINTKKEIQEATNYERAYLLILEAQ